MKLIKLAVVRVAALAAVAAAATFILAKPEPQRKPAGPPPIPDVSGESNWGLVTQDKRKLWVNGNEVWFAKDGELREDGSVRLNWINMPMRREAIGVYKLVGRDFVGHWGWVDDVFEGPQGVLRGPQSDETIRKVAPPDG